ncbi:hypothetical protein [Gemmatimonas sp.]|uniref:hypothetical protein n=1 Tax=Gemmatimonas sp. TaxID=1962908 RepID=UPI00391F2927
MKCARDAMLPEFAPRELFAESYDHAGTRALAREILMMGPSEYAAASKGSAIKRATLWMLQRNACVVLGNIGTAEDLPVLEAMREHEHAIVREHAAWALARLPRVIGAAPRARSAADAATDLPERAGHPAP